MSLLRLALSPRAVVAERDAIPFTDPLNGGTERLGLGEIRQAVLAPVPTGDGASTQAVFFVLHDDARPQPRVPERVVGPGGLQARLAALEARDVPCGAMVPRR